ncbi:MAG: sigma-70 family RNA polymerase sigma factor [Taibaiella sp.]|nr:sigma-70 family RNA polymerase sigma factor [Taibaiella sp.]
MTEAITFSNIIPASERSASIESELYLLVKECIAHNRSAQKKLYDIYAPAAYGIIKRYLFSNDTAANEILNDSFYKIFTKLEQYSFQGAFEGWIRRIVVNTVTDYLRKNIKDVQQHKEVQPEDGYVEGGSVENLCYKELLRLVHTLPEMQLAVFNLFVFENYSHKEIGTLLNINENNSRWYLNDARRRLKEKIQSVIE